MKKSKLSITLVTSFIAAMAMSACSSVSSNKKAVVSFTPYGSKESIALLTDDVYNQYKNTNAGVSKFYDKILEVLIRYEFKDKGFDKGEQKYDEIEKWAENQVKNQKDVAKTNAKSNGTSYDDEWKKILENNSVENAKELKEKFIYEKEKEVIKDWYADNIDTKLRDEFLGVDEDGHAVQSDVKAAMPYHIRHFLVKVDEAGNAQEKFYKGTISESQAKKLNDVVTTLAEGKYTFSEVVMNCESEDGSKDNGGDVGIMTNAASSGSLGMVNEFQLGLYAFDNIYDATNAADPAAGIIKAGLGITDEVVNDLPADVAVVPYEAFVKLGDYAKVTADKYGNQLANGSATLYPRNILWNKYLNLHNVFLIKNAKCGEQKFGTAAANTEFTNLASNTVYDANLQGFNADGYLTDTRGNLIIGVRSEYGVHFMVIEKSMYDYADLATYYDTKVPGQDGYDPNADSYVNYIVSKSTEDYKKRADDVKSKITSFDSTYDYRLYKWFTSEEKYKNNISFEGAAEGLDKSIENYISFLQATNATKQEEGLEKVWRTYNRVLDVQEYNRNAMFNIRDSLGHQQQNLTRLVSEKAAAEFFALYDDPDTYAAYYDDFAEGGIFYYYA